MASRVRRKPAPKLDTDDAVLLAAAAAVDSEDAISPLPNTKRASFALYPDPLLVLQPNPTTPAAAPTHPLEVASSSASSSPVPSPVPRRGLARLLLPHAHSLPRVRKHTISSPTPAEFPTEMIPPALAGLPRLPVTLVDLPRTEAKRVPPPLTLSHSLEWSDASPGMAFGVGVPPLALQVSVSSSTVIPTSQLDAPSPSSSRSSSSSSSGSSHASGETASTSPPVSPLSPLSPLSPVSPISNDLDLKRRGSGMFAKRRPSICASTYTAPAAPTSTSASASSAPHFPSPGPNTASYSSKSSSQTSTGSAKTPKPLPLPAVSPVSRAALARAARLPLVAPSGVRVPFGVLLGIPNEGLSLLHEGDAEEEKQAVAAGTITSCKAHRTLVIFLRHFWCPLCQDYMVSLARAVRAATCDLHSRDKDSACACAVSGNTDTNAADTIPTSTSISTTSTPTSPTTSSTPLSASIPPSLSSIFTPLEEAPPTHDNAQDDAQAEEPRPACTASESVTFAVLEGLVGGTGGDVTSEDTAPHVERPSSPPQQEAAPQQDPEQDEGTHILLIAPGSHTLAERYLASFGFPAIPVSSDSSSLVPAPSTSAAAEFDLGGPLYPSSVPREGEEENHSGQGKRGEKRGRGGVASIRILVDPHPAEGVYAALGMGWAPSRGASPTASAVSSPVASPTLPSFAAAMSASIEGTAGHTSPLPFPSMPTFSAVMEAFDMDATLSGGHDDSHAAPASYVTHGTVSGVGAVLLRALRAGMPVWERGGDVGLLGGEFVFEVGSTTSNDTTPSSSPSLRCTYAHRMQTPRGHASVSRVLAAAGVHVPPEVNEDGTRKVKASQRDKDAQRLVPAVSGSRKGTFGHFKSSSFSNSLARSTFGALPRSMSTTAGTSLASTPALAHASTTDGEHSPVPRSTSTPPVAGIFPVRVAGNIFTRFAVPRGGRAMKEKREREERGRQHDNKEAGVKDDDTTPREHPQISRSASTPSTSAFGQASAIWESREQHGLALVPHRGVGVIWEGQDGEREQEGKVREPAMRATLSASSSRPWALAAAGSSESFSSSDSSIVFKEVCVKTTAASTSTSTSSSDPEPESDPSTYETDPECTCAEEEMYAGSEEGDDEQSGSEDGRQDARVGMYIFPRSVSEYGPGRLNDKSAGVGRSIRAATHGHNAYLDAEEEEGNDEDDVYEYGDGYGSPADVEDAWMLARAKSLARLRARREIDFDRGSSWCQSAASPRPKLDADDAALLAAAAANGEDAVSPLPDMKHVSLALYQTQACASSSLNLNSSSPSTATSTSAATSPPTQPTILAAAPTHPTKLPCLYPRPGRYSPRRGLARLLLRTQPSSLRTRKHTVSSPEPAELQPEVRGEEEKHSGQGKRGEKEAVEIIACRVSHSAQLCCSDGGMPTFSAAMEAFDVDGAAGACPGFAGRPPPMTPSCPSVFLRCIYAHRMQTPRGHASVTRVLATADVHVPAEVNEDGTRKVKTSQREGRAAAHKGRVCLSQGNVWALQVQLVLKQSRPLHVRCTPAFHLHLTSPCSPTHYRPRARTSGRPALGVDSAYCGDIFCPRGAAGNIFTRFAGPRGGMAMKEKREREERGRQHDKDETGAKDDNMIPREHPQIPRSASTPPKFASWLASERHLGESGTARVGARSALVSGSSGRAMMQRGEGA
ncbi:hypothetical protein MVEN_02127800 [Mycena venus]|uniref:Uncharacterized protein n=1 Tax=Mycena venus TaxID=2733690 RepID=A0A8H6X949_9AGAR|nr:hypothetical protein MVEN_02127800 [Mycena venus]